MLCSKLVNDIIFQFRDNVLVIVTKGRVFCIQSVYLHHYVFSLIRFIYFGKLHTHSVGLEPTTIPSTFIIIRQGVQLDLELIGNKIICTYYRR